MGVSVSNLKKEIKRETKNMIVLEGSKNSCTLNQDGITLHGLKGVKIGLIKITQKCEVSSKTYFNAMVKALTKMASKLDVETLTGLGISVSNINESIHDKVENIIKAKCGGSIITQNVGKIEIYDNEDSTFEGIIVDQGGVAKGECMIDTVVDAITENTTETTSKTSGWTFGIGEWMGYIIAGVVVVAGLGVFYKIMSGDKEKEINYGYNESQGPLGPSYSQGSRGRSSPYGPSHWSGPSKSRY